MLRVISIGGITGATIVSLILIVIFYMGSGTITGGRGVINYHYLSQAMLKGMIVGIIPGLIIATIIALINKETSGWLVGLISGFCVPLILSLIVQDSKSTLNNLREAILVSFIIYLCGAVVGLFVGGVMDSLFHFIHTRQR